MSITPELKAQLIKEYATSEGDTGSPDVQIAILSSRIATLTEHFKSHKRTITPVVVCSKWWLCAVSCSIM